VYYCLRRIQIRIRAYLSDYHAIFLATAELILEKQPENEFYPDLNAINDANQTGLQELNKTDGLTVPSELHIEIVQDAEYTS